MNGRSENKEKKKGDSVNSSISRSEDESNEAASDYFREGEEEDFYTERFFFDHEMIGAASISTGQRLDKRDDPINLSHTIIRVSNKDNKIDYELVGTLNKEESDQLREQTGMENQGKVILGKGAYGRVRLIRNIQTGLYSAVKKIKGSTNISLFEDEAKFQKKLASKGLKELMLATDIIYSSTSKGQPVIYQIMPIATFGDGIELINLLARKNEDEKIMLFRHVGSSLIRIINDMHEHHLYHCDFKPDNFLIDLSSNVYISDFGASIIYHTKTQIEKAAKKQINNVLYKPPEYLMPVPMRSREKMHQKADNWQLGLTLLILLLPQEFLDLMEDPAKDNILNKLLKDKAWHNQTDNADQVNHYLQVMPELKELLVKRNIPDDIIATVTGLLEPEWKKRLTAKNAMSILLDNPEKDKDIVKFLNKAKAVQTGNPHNIFHHSPHVSSREAGSHFETPALPKFKK